MGIYEARSTVKCHFVTPKSIQLWWECVALVRHSNLLSPYTKWGINKLIMVWGAIASFFG